MPSKRTCIQWTGGAKLFGWPYGQNFQFTKVAQYGKYYYIFCVQMASYWFVEVSVYFNVFNYVVLFSNIILMFQPRTSMFQQCLLTDTITIQRNFTIRIFFYFSRFEHRNSHLCSIFGNPFSLFNTTNSFQAFSTFVKNGKLIIAPTKTAAPAITEHTTTGITNAGNVRTIDTHTHAHTNKPCTPVGVRMRREIWEEKIAANVNTRESGTYIIQRIP